MGERQINAIAVGAVGAGLVFVWTGIRGGSILTTVQELIKGERPSGAKTKPITIGRDVGGAVADVGLDLAAGAAGGGGTPEQNRTLAKRLAAAYGWSTGSNWASLVKLWERESGWRTTADNPTSDAYGIPQALPGSKMASAGADWRTNPATQIKWGLSYIKGRYGSPDKAWQFWQAHHWY